MKKIYWIVNQLNIDDASISAIEIANRLVQYRSVSIIVLGSNLNIDSNVSGKIDIIYLDIDKKNYELDNLSSYFKANKKELKEKISELTTKNDIIISTSFLSSYIVPKGRRFLYYYLGTYSMLKHIVFSIVPIIICNFLCLSLSSKRTLEI